MKDTYMGSNEELRKENIAARQFTLKYNQMDPADTEGHFIALKSFLGDIGEKSRILAYKDLRFNLLFRFQDNTNYDDQ